MKCDRCGQPGVSLVGESNEIIACIDHARAYNRPHGVDGESASGDVGAEVAAVLAFHRCSDLHADRHDMGGPGVCRSCESWGQARGWRPSPMSDLAAKLRELADDQALLWNVARAAIEDELVRWRDDGMFVLRNNGFVIKFEDGTPNSIIRFGPEAGVRIALRAIADHLDTNGKSNA